MVKMEPLTSMPNLPHFRANKPRLRGRGGDFQFTGGAGFFEQVGDRPVRCAALRAADEICSMLLQ